MRNLIKGVALLLLLIGGDFNSLEAVNSGASFLKIPPGAKPVGMGGAYNAVSGDINAMYYNPAGITDIIRPQIGAMHTEWVSDIRYDYAAGVFKFKEGALGVSATLLTMGELDGRGESRELTDDFSAYDFAMQISYGRNISKNLIGGSFKYIQQKIDDETANGVAVDIGLQREITPNMNLGFTLKNLGPKMKFISEGYDLPLLMGLGSSLTIGGITLAFDTNYNVVDKNINVSCGMEYLPIQILSLRGGYFLNALKETSQIEEVFTPKNGLGGGVGINIFNYCLDYAVVPYSDLGTTQRISLIAGF